MKRNLLLLMSVGLFLNVMSAEQTVIAEPVSATVFFHGAEVEHNASVVLNKGVNEIRVEGLAPRLDLSSIKIGLSDGVVVSTFKYGVDYLSSDRQAVNIKLLEDSIQTYQAELTKIESGIKTNQDMQKLLETGVNHSLNVDRVNITTETIEKNLAYYQQRAAKLLAEKAALETKKTHINERIALLRQQIQQDGTKDARHSGVLTLLLVAPKKVKASMTINYYTNSASWMPYYDINLQEVHSPILMTLKAVVEQSTGLDWENIRLALSTGNPTTSNTKPQLSTWFIRQQYGYNEAALLPKMSRAMNTMSKVERASDITYDTIDEEEVFNTNIVDVTQQTLDVRYTIDIPYTIPGDDREQQVELTVQSIDNVQYKYYVAPKLSNSVFLCATLQEYNKLSLLNTFANITYAGTFYGSTMITTNTTEDELSITLGEDKQMVVKRERIGEMSKTKTLGSNKSEQQVYKITVRNNKTSAATIIVEEPYPISTAKEIQVELYDKNTKATKNDTEHGILTYELTLQPGEQQEITVGYTVKYPKDWRVNF